MDLFISRSKVALSDYPLRLFGHEAYLQEIFELKDHRIYSSWPNNGQALKDRSYYEVNIRASDISREYMREVPEIIEVIDGLGGFAGIVFIFGSLCTKFITKR